MIKQRTDEWFKARTGIFTASNFSKLMAKPADKTAVWSKSAINFIEKAASQKYFNQYIERPDNDATRWGNIYEDAALRKFCKKTEFDYEDIGFILHPKSLDIGATPDARIIEKNNPNLLIVAQVKCPFNTDNHLRYLEKITNTYTLKQCKSAYYWQVQGEIWVSNADYAYFISYDPRLADSNNLLFIKVERNDEDIFLLKEKVEKCIHYRNRILVQIEKGERFARRLDTFW